MVFADTVRLKNFLKDKSAADAAKLRLGLKDSGFIIIIHKTPVGFIIILRGFCY